ncbi:hypothetical protein KBD59_04185 [Candidatus Gracilibacteria bacterium]|nr:hypothetical protein [Candidatus Gracilibacteria bacterium]
MKKLLIVDGTGLIYRGFYAIPPFMKSPTGVQTNAVFGFVSILFNMIDAHKPTHIAVAFDKKGPTFRHEQYKEYKATRVKAPDGLYAQMPLAKDFMAKSSLPLYELAGFEADDIIATVCDTLKTNADTEILVATGDFDLFQVVRPGVKIVYPTKGFREAELFGEQEIIAKYGIRADQIPDYKGIAGDSSDNIPGVRGIGDKGALKLLSQYGTLEGVYEHISEITGATLTKLEAAREMALLSKSLATLRRDVPVEFVMNHCDLKTITPEGVTEACMILGFNSIVKKLPGIFPNFVLNRAVEKNEPKVVQDSLF